MRLKTIPAAEARIITETNYNKIMHQQKKDQALRFKNAFQDIRNSINRHINACIGLEKTKNSLPIFEQEIKIKYWSLNPIDYIYLERHYKKHGYTINYKKYDPKDRKYFNWENHQTAFENMFDTFIIQW